MDPSAQCIARGFKTLFIMTEERFKRYKNQRDKSFKMLRTLDHETLRPEGQSEVDSTHQHDKKQTIISLAVRDALRIHFGVPGKTNIYQLFVYIGCVIGYVPTYILIRGYVWGQNQMSQYT